MIGKRLAITNSGRRRTHQMKENIQTIQIRNSSEFVLLNPNHMYRYLVDVYKFN